MLCIYTFRELGTPGFFPETAAVAASTENRAVGPLSIVHITCRMKHATRTTVVDVMRAPEWFNGSKYEPPLKTLCLQV